MLADQRPDGAVIFRQQRHDVLGLGGLGKRGETTEVAEQRGDLAPVVFQDLLVARRHDRLGKLRRQEPAQPANPLELLDLGRHLGFEAEVQHLHFVVQRLDAQHGAYPGDQRAMVDRLGEIVVAAGVEAGDHVLRRRLGGDHDHRDEGQALVGLQPAHHFQPVDLGHHDVEQDQVGQGFRHFRQGLLAVGRLDHLVAERAQPHAQDLDVIGNVVDHQDAGGVAHDQRLVVVEEARLARGNPRALPSRRMGHR